MRSDVMQANDDALVTIARRFGQQARRIGEFRSRLQRAALGLGAGRLAGAGIGGVPWMNARAGGAAPRRRFPDALGYRLVLRVCLQQ